MSTGEKQTRVLAVMAHPDDAEILVGGTLLYLKSAGWEIGIVTMTGGDCGSATHQKEEIVRIRVQEAKEAAEYLDAWYANAGLFDIEVFLNAENLRRVVELLRSFRPDVLITHSPSDYLIDHEETSRLVRSAAFAMAAPLYQTRHVPPAEVGGSSPALYYADPVEGTDPFGQRIAPQFYVDISPQMEKKVELVAKHASQREWLRKHHGIDEYLEQMKEWSAQCGIECGAAYAEGFRQHLGHGYPREPRIQEALKPHVRKT